MRVGLLALEQVGRDAGERDELRRRRALLREGARVAAELCACADQPRRSDAPPLPFPSSASSPSEPAEGACVAGA